MGGIVQLVDYLEDILKGTIHQPLDGRVSLVSGKEGAKGGTTFTHSNIKVLEVLVNGGAGSRLVSLGVRLFNGVLQ
jgi:hypothetical protein